MFAVNKKAIIAVALTITTLTTSAYAEETASAGAQASSTSLSSLLKKNAKASYTVEVLGAKFKAIDGAEGVGSNININHYPSVGWKLSSKWSVSATQPINQFVRPAVSSTGATQDNLALGDPYINFSNSRIAASERYGTNLYGAVRYYIPMSNRTKNNIGTANDAGNGAIRANLNPTKTFLDGALTVSGNTYARYRFSNSTSAERTAKNGGDANRVDYSILFDPSISYAINSKVEIYLEYVSDYISHNTHADEGKGFFNRFKDGQQLSPGLSYTPIKGLTLNPSIAWGPQFQLNNMDVTFIASYSIL